MTPDILGQVDAVYSFSVPQDSKEDGENSYPYNIPDGRVSGEMIKQNVLTGRTADFYDGGGWFKS